jgi:hypothetical protein
MTNKEIFTRLQELEEERKNLISKLEGEIETGFNEVYYNSLVNRAGERCDHLNEVTNRVAKFLSGTPTEAFFRENLRDLFNNRVGEVVEKRLTLMYLSSRGISLSITGRENGLSIKDDKLADLLDLPQAVTEQISTLTREIVELYFTGDDMGFLQSSGKFEVTKVHLERYRIEATRKVYADRFKYEALLESIAKAMDEIIKTYSISIFTYMAPIPEFFIRHFDFIRAGVKNNDLRITGVQIKSAPVPEKQPGPIKITNMNPGKLVQEKHQEPRPNDRFSHMVEKPIGFTA